MCPDPVMPVRHKPDLIKSAVAFWSEAGKQNLIPVSGRSMLPVLQEGDFLLVDHTLQNVKPGHILVYRRGEDLIAHRIYRIQSSSDGRPIFLTKGDNSIQADKPVMNSEIIGTATAVYRKESCHSCHHPLMKLIGFVIAVMTRWEVSVFKRSQGVQRPASRYLSELTVRTIHKFDRMILKIANATLVKFTWKHLNPERPV
jgi:signal peptidase I